MEIKIVLSCNNKEQKAQQTYMLIGDGKNITQFQAALLHKQLDSAIFGINKALKKNKKEMSFMEEK